MYFEISAIIAVVLFAVLVIYVIRTLVSLQQTLRRIDQLLLEVDIKMEKLDSTLKSISNMGDICENETQRLRDEYLKSRHRESLNSDYSQDLAEWLVSSLKLGAKFLRRK